MECSAGATREIPERRLAALPTTRRSNAARVERVTKSVWQVVIVLRAAEGDLVGVLDALDRFRGVLAVEVRVGRPTTASGIRTVAIGLRRRNLDREFGHVGSRSSSRRAVTQVHATLEAWLRNWCGKRGGASRRRESLIRRMSSASSIRWAGPTHLRRR